MTDCATPMLVPTRPDAQVAAELKERMRAALHPVCAILDEAIAGGLILEFNIGQIPPFNKHGIQRLTVTKHL